MSVTGLIFFELEVKKAQPISESNKYARAWLGDMTFSAGTGRQVPGSVCLAKYKNAINLK